MSRILCQFSCGAASAVATKLAVAEYPASQVMVLNAFLAAEHPDNRRFFADCQKWIGREFTVLRDEKYNADPIEVFRRTRYIKGPNGASCSSRLKRDLLRALELPGDVLVLGYTAEEQDRLDDFRDHFPDRPVLAPLIEKGLTKDDCKAMVKRAGIEIPMMYRLGYDNANCIGCVKGGAGYFRAIREDFPQEFERLAQVEEEIGPGAYILLHRSGPLKGQRFPLRELSKDGPVRRNERVPSCSFYCEIAEQEYSE
jgi:hypothetical protein